MRDEERRLWARLASDLMSARLCAAEAAERRAAGFSAQAGAILRRARRSLLGVGASIDRLRVLLAQEEGVR
jgi:hypothetical protein